MSTSKVLCGFEGCGRSAVCKGLCNGHYTQQYKGLPLTPLRTRRTVAEVCNVGLCEERARNFSSGQPLCNRHHVRWKKYGDAVKTTKAMVVPRGMDAITDAVARRDRTGCWTDWADLDCWDDLDGYGGASVNGYPSLGRSRVMHLVLEADGQPRPPAPANYGLHSCDDPQCWNPDHLRWGSHEENLADRSGKQNYCRHCAHCNPV